jgi:hypothetical protein
MLYLQPVNSLNLPYSVSPHFNVNDDCICVQVIKHYAMEMYGRVEVNLQAFLTLPLDGGKLSA